MSIADDISTGYNAGRRMGNDWASSRFAKADAKLRAEIAQRAETEVDENGQPKPLEDYFEEYKQRAIELADKKGVRRRGVMSGGKRLEDAAVDDYQSYVTDAAARRGGRAAAAGDLAGGARDVSRASYKMGDFATGTKLDSYADDVASGQRATGPDGKVDVLALSRDKVGNAARHGDVAGAQQADSENTAFLKQKSNELYGQARVLAGSGGMEQAVAVINGAFADDPRVPTGSMIREGADGNYHMELNGTVYGDPIQPQELGQLIETYAQDPDKALQAAVAARAEDAHETRKTQREQDVARTKALAEFVAETIKAGVAPATAKDIGESRADAARAGWKFETPQQGEDGTSFQLAVAPDGTAVRIQFNDGPSTVDGGPSVPIMMTDLDGNVVRAADLEGGDAVASYAAAVQRTGNVANVMTLLKVGVSAIDQIFGGEGGGMGAPAQGEAPVDPKAVQQDYRDLAKKHGFTITSMERAINPKLGAGTRSQHPKGTAVDLSIKDKSQKEIEAVMADARALGYEPILERKTSRNTGPHIHIEIPPEGIAAAPAAPAASPQQAVTMTPFKLQGVDRFGRKTGASVPSPAQQPAPVQPSSGFLSGGITMQDVKDFFSRAQAGMFNGPVTDEEAAANRQAFMDTTDKIGNTVGRAIPRAGTAGP
jgi:hypothetical protein